MLRALFVALVSLVPALEMMMFEDAPTDLSANAALKYWQAFAALPRLTAAQEKKLDDECVTMPLDAHARKLVAEGDYALNMTRLGAAIPGCEWAIGFEEGIGQRLPHAQAARVLCSLSCLRARLRFEAGRDAAAVDDIVAALALGRQVSRDGYLVSILVRYVIEDRMSQTLATHLPVLSTAMLKDLKTRLAALPQGGSTATAARDEEKAGVDWLVRTAKDAERRVKDGEDQKAVLASRGGVLDEFIEKCGGTLAGVIKNAEQMRPWYAEISEIWDLPLDRFEKERELVATKYAENPLFKMFTPGITKVRHAQARAEVRRTLLAAAIDIQLSGRDALKNHPDPVAGGLFEYKEFAGWFELRSKWTLASRPLYRDETPLALTVGQRGK
jgi:hypothetical protein